ncbi:MAG: hypothetical protein JST66_05320 [Bacteroidetes bacterium]|nr:hypothetical protein [Bacteroidota bacterium]
MKRLLFLAWMALALPLGAHRPAPSAGAFAVPVETTVYVTKTGGKYHKGTCGYLSKSKIAMALSEAKAAGYGPCSRCKPPQ